MNSTSQLTRALAVLICAVAAEPLTAHEFWIDAKPEGKEQVFMCRMTVRPRTPPSERSRAPMATGAPGLKKLLNAVRIEAVEGPGNAVWQSHWASLTFDIDALE